MKSLKTGLIHLEGSCLCGAVVYQLETRLKNFYFCHCQQCRKLTGSAHAANILAEPVSVDWVRGTDKIKRYDAPDDRSFTHVFCRDCGSGLPFLNVSETTLFIPAGSLDSAPDIEVDCNIFWDEAPAWYESALSARRCKAFP